jgi:hypothetical protein
MEGFRRGRVLDGSELSRGTDVVATAGAIVKMLGTDSPD